MMSAAESSAPAAWEVPIRHRAALAVRFTNKQKILCLGGLGSISCLRRMISSHRLKGNPDKPEPHIAKRLTSLKLFVNGAPARYISINASNSFAGGSVAVWTVLPRGRKFYSAI